MAELAQCSQGHFFDSAKHTSCPWCGVGPDPAGGGEAGATKRISDDSSEKLDAPPPTPPTRTAPPQAEGVTRRIGVEPSTGGGFDPVVGWLVCIEGKDRGKDYRLRTAKNFIGRSPSMDVSLAGDDTVSRERHAVVAFEPSEKKFWLLPGDAQGLVYCNDKVVHTPAELEPDDVIKVGESKLMFVPFCGDRHQWE